MNDEIRMALASCGIDLKDAMNRFVNNENLYEEMIIHFFESSTELIDIKSCLESKDYVNAYHYAHSLKGVSGNLSIMPVYILSAKLSDLLKNNHYSRIRPVFKELCKNYQSTKNTIKKIYPHSNIQ